MHALQRAVYLAVTAAALAATLLLLLALWGSARLFAVASWSVGATVAVTTVLLGLEARRQWLSSAHAVGWIDRRARLRGGLATLVGLRGRRDHTHGGFLPLLTEESLRQRETWLPSRMVRRPVPIGALSAAIAACGAFLLALSVAPAFEPHVPEIVYSDEPVEGGSDRIDGVPDRVVIAPSAESMRRKEDPFGAAMPGPGDRADEEQSPLASLPSGLQERIRQELWGEAWSRMRDALARAEREANGADTASASTPYGSEEADDEGTTSQDGEGDDEEWEQAALPSTQRGGDDGSGAESSGGRSPSGGKGRTARRTRFDGPDGGESVDDGAPAAGAGAGTDPNLYGAPTERPPHTAGTFELGIAARVRGRRGPPGPAAGDAPPAPRDARPELASGQRTESPAHHMAVPAAYESLVREVFAHRHTGTGATP